ncbi:Uncharacterized protein DBV15_12635 [Temnothorax longispinosus]|uniref:Uncharacterized protein n=1 Tax=Temnothorax longispinosus TaxID=300112 RepID=A0A4S2JX24_9HYME|nr:Uncharacterized protein DBV15_12635 [Temnothorax longispinosus]
MVPRAFYENVLPEDSQPEMLRASLENVILRTKVLDMGKPEAILALALDPPNLSDIQKSILLLKEIDALTNNRDESEHNDGNLTPLGCLMLRTFGITETMCSEKNSWSNLDIDRNFVLKFIIAGAFYPNYFTKIPYNVNTRKRDIEKTLSNRDPTTTVVLHDWPSKHPGSLYSKRFWEIFGQQMKLKNPENIIVSFDESNRVYIQHEPKNRAPDDYTFVRDCVKMRHCQNKIKIKLSSETSETTARQRADDDFWLMEAYERFMSQPSNPKESPSLWCERYISADEKPYPSHLSKKSEYRSKMVKLQGPFSPIEVRLTHMATVPMTKERGPKVISVKSTSVNSVLLDTCPASPKGFFLVAQTISRDTNNPLHLILQNTTLLPATPPGLASLVPLIFTPYMELRRSPVGTRYTGALCGLGYDRTTQESLLPDHDLEIKFDVEIKMNDLRMINKLRHWMNVGMKLINTSETVDFDDEVDRETPINCQNQIKNAFKCLLYIKNRKEMEPSTVPVSNFNQWNLYDETLFLVPIRKIDNKNDIYCLHKALELTKNTKEEEKLEEMVEHLLELKALAHP